MSAGFLYVVVLFVLEFEGEGDASLWLPMYAAAGATAVASIVVPRFLVRGPVEGGLDIAIQRYMTQRIVALALAEAVILFGFVASFVAQEPLGVLPFFVLGELLMVINFPRVSALEALLSPQALIEWSQRS